MNVKDNQPSEADNDLLIQQANSCNHLDIKDMKKRHYPVEASSNPLPDPFFVPFFPTNFLRIPFSFPCSF